MGLKCLRVTEIIGCDLKLWLKQRGIYDQLPPHPLGLAGQELHKAIEDHIKGNFGEPAFKYVHNVKKYANFKTWINTQNLTDVKSEQRYFKQFTSQPKISGKFDFVNGQVLWDFKSAKRVSPKHSLQLGGYKWIAEANGLNIKYYGVVLLGDTNPVSYILQPNIRGFETAYEHKLEILQAKSIYNLDEPILDMGCVFCEYIHHCRRL